jgi:hypothetical protein
MFPIFDVSESIPDRPETIGSKEKIWLMPQPTIGLPIKPHLFKIGRPNTGENWAEKACCEIAKVYNIPCAEYHLAVCKGVEGVLSERFLPPGSSFHPANTMFATMDREYDGALRFKQVRYKLLSALSILRHLRLSRQVVSGSSFEAHDLFIGYLLFDALVGNTDRHHENWGVMVVRGEAGMPTFHLAPTFDHASSLGRELSDDARRQRLASRDKRASVEAYAHRARSAFYGSGPTGRTMTSREVVESRRLRTEDAYV